jgi:uncharacterized protein (DUF169 family)
MPITPELLQSLADVRLSREPVAVAFLADPPPGMERVSRAAPAGCGYWKQASEGQAFYTTADDHGNCPIGAFTHGVALSPAQNEELRGLIGTMVELKYLKTEEVPAIPHRVEPLRVAAYAPLPQATFEPDMVVFRGNARQIMLLSEAARAAGVFGTSEVMGRPACSMLPQTVNSGASVASVGCIGNRVYTSLGDDELYLTVPGERLPAVLEKLGTTLHANAELERFHRGRAAALGADTKRSG